MKKDLVKLDVKKLIRRAEARILAESTGNFWATYQQIRPEVERNNPGKSNAEKHKIAMNLTRQKITIKTGVRPGKKWSQASDALIEKYAKAYQDNIKRNLVLLYLASQKPELPSRPKNVRGRLKNIYNYERNVAKIEHRKQMAARFREADVEYRPARTGTENLFSLYAGTDAVYRKAGGNDLTHPDFGDLSVLTTEEVKKYLPKAIVAYIKKTPEKDQSPIVLAFIRNHRKAKPWRRMATKSTPTSIRDKMGLRTQRQMSSNANRYIEAIRYHIAPKTASQLVKLGAVLNDASFRIRYYNNMTDLQDQRRIEKIKQDIKSAKKAIRSQLGSFLNHAKRKMVKMEDDDVKAMASSLFYETFVPAELLQEDSQMIAKIIDYSRAIQGEINRRGLTTKSGQNVIAQRYNLKTDENE